MDAVHYGNISEYYVHSMFGFLESRATFNFLKTVNDLAFIISRSSFYGSGQFTGHWTGDNGASYEWLAVSIPTVINTGIYGMPMAGSDICGFGEDTTEESTYQERRGRPQDTSPILRREAWSQT